MRLPSKRIIIRMLANNIEKKGTYKRWNEMFEKLIHSYAAENTCIIGIK